MECLMKLDRTKNNKLLYLTTDDLEITIKVEMGCGTAFCRPKHARSASVTLTGCLC